MSTTTNRIPRPAPERVLDLSEPNPIDQLAAAYAERLAALRAGAGSTELAASEQRIRDLETTCRRSYARPSRTPVPDTALYLG
jgi:hypothetical protein